MDEIKKIASTLIKQRKNLGLEQKDMYMRIGMKQQQYQRVEAGNDIKLSTFLRVLEGLDLALSIVQKDSHKTSLQFNAEKTHLPDDQEDLQTSQSDDLDFWTNITRTK
ncbi:MULTISPECIES: helix-turn-helix domain-containing protein [Providencia]|uniref:helix-turn-helix domain-containing protein n=1 Tax=Providencia TaxID=586 RepID=UPI00197CD6E7|nr:MULTISPECIES: helix-turn-helix domain-containing protein [Providencia]HEC8329821.1 helix-turn-helix domain-containing protein [Providencia rettgeri]MBN4863852.1 helix-turn-helix domain-containing protein [Providencia stuartii]MBN4873174.1 helix-turn-helix domain-containing protein [Providencia stuartii]MBN4877705.1 helix-turn-helix domain-containing protein [Providencia stuartii]MBN4882375.1 helix-turn-helix domain-containing protein [Providencia stuartii]